MGALSIGKAWEEAVAFVAREATLLFPVALLFIALPSVILQEMTPPELSAWMAATTQPRPPLPPIPPAFALAGLLTILLIWFGSLTLFALALRPGISVGEALRLGLARLPVLIGTGLLVLAGFTGAFLVVVVLAGLLSMGGAAAAALAATLAGLAIACGAIFVGVRLVLLNPVVIDGHDGVVAALRKSWALTQGHFWRLFAFLLILTILSTIVAIAAQAVFGSIAGLAGGASAAEFVGGVVGAAASTAVQVYMLVMLARLYRQAQPQEGAGIYR
jgi:hypothetical protein